VRGEDFHVGVELYVRSEPNYAWVLETYVDTYQHVDNSLQSGDDSQQYYVRRRSHLETLVLHVIEPGGACYPMQDYLPEKRFMLTFKKLGASGTEAAYQADFWCDGFDATRHRRGILVTSTNVENNQNSTTYASATAVIFPA
jgi:hypothetical protein